MPELQPLGRHIRIHKGKHTVINISTTISLPRRPPRRSIHKRQELAARFKAGLIFRLYYIPAGLERVRTWKANGGVF